MIHQGVLLGILAGAFWGLPFITPSLLPDHAPWQLALGRFFGFGIVSLIWSLLRPGAWGLVREFPTRLIGFSLMGFTLYSFLLFWGVQLSNPVFASLLIGFLPVTIAALGSRRTRLSRSFWIGVGLCVSGVVVSQLEDTAGWATPSLSGVVVLLICLGLWTSYAVFNSEFLKTNSRVSASNWSCALGLVSFFLIVPLLIWGLLYTPDLILQPRYIAVSIVLGMGSSFLANIMWNRASQILPSSWLGPLITSETFFGVVFGHVVKNQDWKLGSVVALGLMILGVVVALLPRSSRSPNSPHSSESAQ